MEKTANRLRELRKVRGQTQEEMAKDLGVTRQTVISIEKGEYIPSTTLALKIARLLKKPVEDIFWLE
ncbi:MAG: transcriptional regulator [Candidatus Kerfeldbacteria bacterium RIFCSPLOWO2_01_FULL_48_11]|uniref:Transcriptional regulator n=1 Tax=Candidatus Kerfeldbacteria bacterium RIFCSPLOWO2_01_FULL_48_11 TaxID=1798543 RepID=A0A1G2B4E7_9BACT|nr:MAG: XRE family transcriptional regulator [Parcubacteria group bacterium GW2011_GWA2_48_9]KKW16082.1 MAG: XRE family transcriptional regulator [Parcubacteria group bacterium GW2011_GWC2_49_9]OGY84042.1 MAG: transcriptional regulator [Candidatus Kerfeldbacteria bacterium RIFCSPLOWO2_01_FULL_48_11]HCM68717.1 transcriptional regulator [Candidatus Kerfeldbacteria bacterium]